MRPTVHLRQERDASASGVVEIRAAVRAGNGSAQRLWTLPYLPRRHRSARRRPRWSTARALDEHGVGRATGAASSHERDARSVGRPARRLIDRRRRRDPFESASTLSGIDADHRVVAARRHERELRAVRRPLRIARRAVRGEQSASPATIHRSERPDRAIAGRRRRRRSSARSPVRRRRRFASAFHRRRAQTRSALVARRASTSDSAAAPPVDHCALRRARRRRTCRQR